MKILQLCKKFPYPLKDGESIAVTFMSRAMATLGHELTLLAMNTTKHYININELPEDFNHYTQIHTVEIDNRLKPADAFLNLFSKESYHISRFVSADYKNKLAEILTHQSFDIIQLETVYLAPYIDTIRKHTDAKVVMRAHNVEFEIWERIAQQTANPIKKWYVNLLTKRLKEFEISQLANYDALVAITERDLNYFKKLGFSKAAHVTPIGLDLVDYTPNIIPSKSVSLSFIGSLDWMPNLEGVDWIVKHLAPLLAEKFPNINIHIAGRNTPDHLLKLNKSNIIIEGEVPDARAFINQHDIMLVPLFSGSGMRAKILEGMALGKVIITTSLGVEGIDAEDNKHIMIADDATAFLSKISTCIKQPQVKKDLGYNAKVLIREKYSNSTIAKSLSTFFESMV